MPTPFLTAEWRKLIMANYAIDPGLLRPYLPAGTVGGRMAVTISPRIRNICDKRIARPLSPIMIGWIGVKLSISCRPICSAPRRNWPINWLRCSRRQCSVRNSSRLFSVAQASAGG